jgi:hypothetical protein
MSRTGKRDEHARWHELGQRMRRERPEAFGRAIELHRRFKAGEITDEEFGICISQALRYTPASAS